MNTFKQDRHLMYNCTSFCQDHCSQIRLTISIQLGLGWRFGLVLGNNSLRIHAA